MLAPGSFIGKATSLFIVNQLLTTLSLQPHRYDSLSLLGFRLLTISNITSTDWHLTAGFGEDLVHIVASSER